MSICATIGKPIYTDFDVCIHDGFVVFEDLKVDKEFIYYYLEKIQKRWYRYGQLGTQVNLNSDIVSNEKIKIPIELEQHKIAAFLSAVDTRIEQLSRGKSFLLKYKQGMMQKLFSQEIRFKHSQWKDYPDWEEKFVRDICEINPSNGGLPDQFTYIDLDSVYQGLLVKENKISRRSAPSRAQRILKKSDVLFQTVRPYQQNNFFFTLTGDYVASTGYAQFRAKYSPLFLYYLLHEQRFVRTVLTRCTGTSYPAINSSDIGSIRIYLPCEKEQQKIAEFLSAIDRKIELVTSQIEQARLFKTGLLQQMFI